VVELCHLVLTKIGTVANPFRCTIYKGEKYPRVSDATPSRPPLVRRSFELSPSPDIHGPTPTNYASVRGADVRTGVIELTTSMS